MSILLSTLNARFSHASLGLRYLMANMGELAPITHIQEFVIGIRAADAVEKFLAHRPHIIGFGVYIWNVDELTHIVALLNRVAPEVIIILGGPEVSHEPEEQAIVKLADYVVTGWGDISFTQRWKLSANINYDFESSKISNARFTLARNMHCWALSFYWTPIGGNKSFLS